MTRRPGRSSVSSWAARLVRAAAFAGATAGATAATTAAATPAAAAPADPNEARAFELFGRGADAYKAGRFQESIDLLKQAYALKPEPILLYNLARAYEGLGQSADAVKAYSDYLKARPDAADRGAIEARIATLQAQIDKETSLTRAKEEAERAARAAEERSKWAPPEAAAGAGGRGASPWPWALAGAGGAALAAGGVLGGLALAKHGAAQSDAQTTYASDASTASTFATVANVCFAAGGALAAAGVIWGIVDLRAAGKASKEKEGAAPAVALVVRPGWAGVAVTTP